MSIAKKQVAILQAMGVDVYAPYEPESAQAAIKQKDWFDSLLSFLDLDASDCEFSDTLPIRFDSINKTLILPLTISKDDAALKREIWQHIQDNATQQ
jgi:hypothetical protein